MALYEHVFKAKGVPGYTLEQFFNLGSTELKVRLDAEEELFNEIVDELKGIKQKNIHPLYTWIHQVSAMLDHVTKV